MQQQLSKKEIEDLLRRGAYGAIMDEEDEGAKFCEEDIDQILQRRTKTITIESEGRGSTFAKVNKTNKFISINGNFTKSPLYNKILICPCLRSDSLIFIQAQLITETQGLTNVIKAW